MTAETFKLVFVVALAVSLMALGLTSFKKKVLEIGFGGRGAARPLFTLTLRQMGASIFGLASIIGSAIILALVTIAMFVTNSISIDNILSIAVILAFVTVAGGFTLAAVVQLAKNVGGTMTKEDKIEEK
jgi:hypothetical protein